MAVVTDQTKGGYPAGDKPPSELKPPPASMTLRATDVVLCTGCGRNVAVAPCRCVTPWSTPAGRLVAGSVAPPHRCDPAQLWADLGGKTRTASAKGAQIPDASSSVRIECTCGQQWRPACIEFGVSYGTHYRDGWASVPKPKPQPEYPPPGLHPNREDIAREHPVSLRTFWRWITRA